MTDNDLDRVAVVRLASDFDAAWNRRDVAAFSQLFTDDAEYVNVVGMWWRGQTQIREGHARTHARFVENNALNWQVESLKFLTPDVALVHIGWQVTARPESKPDARAPGGGILALTAVKGSAGWRIAAAQNTNEVPEALARMSA